MNRTDTQHTAATRHPGWNGIVTDIENRFGAEIVRTWCIDAVSAYLLGVHDRAKHVLICLGEVLSRALAEICKKHGVDLDTLQVTHVKS